MLPSVSVFPVTTVGCIKPVTCCTASEGSSLVQKWTSSIGKLWMKWRWGIWLVDEGTEKVYTRVYPKVPPPGPRTANGKLSATRYSCIAILWVSLVSFAAITLYVASQRSIPNVSVNFVIDSVQKLLDTPSYRISLSPNSSRKTKRTQNELQ
jgi:hypothetical protein